MSGPLDVAFPPGTQFGAYRIVRSLGSGASGAVYEVLKTSVGKRMALKVLHRSLNASDDDLMRFEREARVSAAIEHPNVVQVFDVGDHEGHRFMTMELLEGETLQEKLEREGTLSVKDVADLFVPLMSALGAVHDQGIVHRDLKPGNIFLVARRPGVVEPKLLDFGVIKDLTGIVGGDMTRAHSMVGSPSYMSPEQAEQASTIDVRSDQFTVGSIIWECLIGRKLFDGETLYQVLFKIADDPIPSVCAARPDVPVELDALILRALERDPGRRFSSAREIGGRLLPYCSEHVRAVWCDELMASVDESSDFDDEVTSMRPSMSVIGPAAIQPAYDWNRAKEAPPPMEPQRVSDAGQVPMPLVSLPSAPTPTWQPPESAEAPWQFSGDETFRPASLAANPPARHSRAAWGALAAVICVTVLAITALLSVRREAPHAPVATAASALARSPQAALHAEPALPSATDAGAAPSRSGVALPATPAAAAQPAIDPNDGAAPATRRDRPGRNKPPRAPRAPRYDVFGH